MTESTGAGARTAIVTGGSRGIGRGVALALAREGYSLAITHYGDDEHAASTAEEVSLISGKDCFVLPGDLRVPGVAEAAAHAAMEAMGRIDVLVNNAGISKFDPVDELSVERMDDMMRLNFRAPLLLMRDVSRHMIRLCIHGSIVNITSSRAERAYPGDAVYGGLKAGLKRASESAAMDLAPYGIRVNCLAPGAILVRERTPRLDKLGEAIPLGRMGLPEDIGRAAAWLVSDAASYVTGTTLRVDGGLIVPGMPEDGVSYWGAKQSNKKRGQEP
jgi:glucose 1-dehydrogenase